MNGQCKMQPPQPWINANNAGTRLAFFLLAIFASSFEALAAGPASLVDTVRSAMNDEYLAADEATRARLACLAKADAVGAALQEKEVIAHRQRFFDFKRQLQSLNGANSYPPSLEAVRVSLHSSNSSAERGFYSPAEGPMDAREADRRPTWDLYRAHDTSVRIPTASDADGLQAGQSPRNTAPASSSPSASEGLELAKPYLVFRSSGQVQTQRPALDPGKFIAMKSQQ